MTLFRDEYRIATTRLKQWDYTKAGYYFVTICTKDRECFLGEIIEGKMILSDIGLIVREEWLKTEKIRANLFLDEWVIMPNHIHGIIVIRNNSGVETPRRGVSTAATLLPGSLGSIIGQFKSKCTRRIWVAGHRHFAWQSRFFDHIIRGDASLQRIKEYIMNNPVLWSRDRNHPENVEV